jgi:hypothetical protein
MGRNLFTPLYWGKPSNMNHKEHEEHKEKIQRKVAKMQSRKEKI